MSQSVVSVQELGKAYRLGMKQEAYPTLRESIVRMVKAPLQRLRAQAEAVEGEDVFWALDDVSFDVQQGEVLGLVGRNGAGKSTLLKLLSRITEPTRGRAVLRGRVASLLEVGTGFHPELTGRENVYLNGSILGMHKVEIDAKFDEIVAFSEVEKFLDTPVKYYSSGMYVRLAFAVAAHLDPELLIVDEVLAVGDAQFQKKCLGKMHDISQSGGRTVLFVSHNMSAVQNLCTRAILLHKGKLEMDDKPDAVVRNYLARLSSGSETAFTDNPERSGNGSMRMTAARLVDDKGQKLAHIDAGQPITVEVDYENPTHMPHGSLVLGVMNHLGIHVTVMDSMFVEGKEIPLSERGTFRCRIPRTPLPLGEYRIAMALNAQGQIADKVPNGLVFTVESSSFYNTFRTPPIQWCAVMVDQQWQHADAGAGVAHVEGA